MKKLLFIGGCKDGESQLIPARCNSICARPHFEIYKHLESRMFGSSESSEIDSGVQFYHRETIQTDSGQVHFFKWEGISTKNALEKLIEGYKKPKKDR